MSVHKFALLGCGKIATKHLEIITSDLSNAKLVAVCDLDQAITREVAKRYQVPGYTDVRKMIDQDNPDTVVILTPSGIHAQNIQELSLHNVNLIIEKPIALKIDDAENIIKLCRDKHLSLSVVKQNRFNKPILLLKQYIDEGKLGNLFMSSIRVRWSRSQSYYDQANWRGTWKFDGGVITNQASHHIDMMQWLMGEVESVYAKAGNFGSQIEAEDTAVVVIKFKSGALGTIEASTALKPKDIEGSISVLGNKGSIEIGGFAMNTMKVCEIADLNLNFDKNLDIYDNPRNDRNYAHREFYKDYINRFKNNERPLVGAEEAFKSLSIIHAIYKSIQEKREVFLNEDKLQSRLGV